MSSADSLILHKLLLSIHHNDFIIQRGLIMIKVKLADVVVQVHIRDEYSWQRVLYCPWVNCKYYNDAKFMLQNKKRSNR